MFLQTGAHTTNLSSKDQYPVTFEVKFFCYHQPTMEKLIHISKRLFLGLLAGALFLYLLAIGYLYTSQESLLFFPRPVAEENLLNYEEFNIHFTVNNQILEGWFIPGTLPETIIYYGGNGSELSERIAQLRQLGDFNYLLVNYRGYGASTGEPAEIALKNDALSIYDQALDALSLDTDKVVLVGRSLGTGVAIHVAANRPAKSLVLITPYDSIQAIAEQRYPVIPVALLLRHPFDSLAYTADITIPTLFIKASRDFIVPHQHTDALIDAWGSEFQLESLPGNHNTVVSSTEFNTLVSDFIVQPEI